MTCSRFVVTIASILVACGPGDPSLDSDGGTDDAGSVGVGAWLRMAAAPLDGRFMHATAWTGQEMIVWGGLASELEDPDGDCSRAFGDGAAYDPAANTWRMIAEPGTARGAGATAWIGDEMLVVGGPVGGCADKGGEPDHQVAFWGARYRPDIDQWTAISSAGLPIEVGGFHPDSVNVWTGEELFIWSGSSRRGYRYSVVADTWTSVSSDGAISLSGAVGVWTGAEIIVWGHKAEEPCCVGGGAIYDLASDTWRAMSEEGAPAGSSRAAIWSATEMLLFTGASGNGAYDPATDRWRPLHGEDGTFVGDGVWTGNQMFGWPYRLVGVGREPQGGVYDLETDSWTLVPVEAGPRGAGYGSLVWTGTEVIVWGGGIEVQVATGARFAMR